MDICNLIHQIFGESDPNRIIGRVFKFEWRWSASKQTIIGRISGIDIVSETQLLLNVSNTTFGGLKLDCLSYTAGQWSIWVMGGEIFEHFPEAAEHRGQFSLM